MKTPALVVVLALCATCGGDGNQPLPVRTTVKWVFDSYPALGIAEGDNCTDLGIAKVQVDLTPGAISLSDSCTVRQVVFMDVPPGSYTASVTPLDGSGASLVKAPTTIALDVGGGDTETLVNVPWDAWTMSYKGAFYFKITWGGADCPTAMPPVVTQLLTVTQGGTAIALKSDSGHKVDGTDPEPCRAGNEFVSQMPFGPTTVQIIGKDALNVVQYQKQFDTFAGAGPTNPTDVYDVPGPPDAMPPDAGPPDASM